MRRFISALALVCLLTAAALAAETFPPSSTPTIPGIDVSSWQRTIDWARVRASGIEIAMLRASEGTQFVDPYFDRNDSGARAAGVKVGYYHFLTAQTEAEAIAQADHFVSVIGDRVPDCLLAVDYGGGSGLSGEALTANAEAFLERVQARTGYGVMLYTDAWAAKARYGASIARYPIWVANYGVSEPEANGKWSAWVGFQYYDRGDIAGISGNVDLDRFTREVYQGGGPTPTPTLTPTPTPTSTPTPTPTSTPTPTPTPAPTPTSTPTPTPTPMPSPTPVIGSETLYYEAQSEEAVASIARRLGTSEGELRALNDIVGDAVGAGQIVRYPSSAASSGEAFAGLHILRPKESLGTIARRYGTTVDALARLNALSGRTAPIGQVLRVPDAPGRGDVAQPPSWLLENVVVTLSGQTVASIAQRYGIAPDALLTINGLTSADTVYAGQILHLQAYGRDETVGFAGGYVVRRGDTLVRIAERFGTTSAELYELNNIANRNLIFPGQILLLPGAQGQ